jgi:hypothetical protein
MLRTAHCGGYAQGADYDKGKWRRRTPFTRPQNKTSHVDALPLILSDAKNSTYVYLTIFSAKTSQTFALSIRGAMSRFIAILMLLIGSLIPMAQAKTTAKAVHPGAVSDAQIESTIRTKLAKSKIGKDGFSFRVSHGTVTWEGTTSVIQHKASATRMAHAAGATQVVNHIQISGAAKEKAAANLKKAHVTE